MSKRLFWIFPCTACEGKPRHFMGDSGRVESTMCYTCNNTREIREEVTTPSDDGDEITPEWIQSFVPQASQRLGVRLCWQAWADGDLSVWLNGGVFEWRRFTRGQFRRLCAALGVELKEGG